MLKNTNMTFTNFSNKNNEVKEFSFSDTSSFDKKKCLNLLASNSLSAQELLFLLDARAKKIIHFLLIDNREMNEYLEQRIVGTDFLVPTSSFYESMEVLSSEKNTPCVVYCLSGGRSAQCLNIMKNMGYTSVCNLQQGLYTYKGEFTSGK